jgi:hypothetical protein
LGWEAYKRGWLTMLRESMKRKKKKKRKKVRAEKAQANSD